MLFDITFLLIPFFAHFSLFLTGFTCHPELVEGSPPPFAGSVPGLRGSGSQPPETSGFAGPLPPLRGGPLPLTEPRVATVSGGCCRLPSPPHSPVMPDLTGHLSPCHPEQSEGSKSSRRKTKVVSFPPTFVFRPLTPPYVPFGIRRFLILCAFEHSSPSGRGNPLCEGCLLTPLAALYRCQRLPNIPCSHCPTYTPSMA